MVLTSCQYVDTRLKNPQISDLQGKWESLSIMQYIPYALIDINEQGEGVVIFATEDNVSALVTFDSFKSYEREFEVNVKFLDGEDEAPEKMRGSIDNGQLCFYIDDKDEASLEKKLRYKMCFTKYEQVKNLRQKGLKYLNEWKRTHNK